MFSYEELHVELLFFWIASVPLSEAEATVFALNKNDW